MNILPRNQQVEAIAALCEGVSIRATSRLTGVDRGTVMNLGVVVGRGCAVLHDTLMRDLQLSRIELDEAWSFVAKKQKQVRQDDPDDFGDQYVFVALAGAAKAIISYRVAKRTARQTLAFVRDLRARVLGAPEISSDAFRAYPIAIELAFKGECDFGTIDKQYAAEAAIEARRRYSPAAVVGVTRKVVHGSPVYISTSYVERQNLTLRMQQRRFTRLTNAFSKKLENHMAAVALYVAHYNFCRVHEALRVTPAMQVGVTDHIWTIGELVNAALAGVLPERTPEPPLGYAPFTVVKGGKA
jgi:IS1 family transposase